MNVTVPGISSCSLAAYPSAINSAACLEAQIADSVLLITEKRPHRGLTDQSEISVLGFGFRATVWHKIAVYSTSLPGCTAWLDVGHLSPVLSVVRACQRGLWLPMTSGTNPDRGFCAVLSEPLYNVTFLRPTCEQQR